MRAALKLHRGGPAQLRVRNIAFRSSLTAAQSSVIDGAGLSDVLSRRRRFLLPLVAYAGLFRLLGARS